MSYPEKPEGIYSLRDYDFASNDSKKVPMSEYLFKNGYKNADESDVESVPDGHEQNWLFDVLHRNLRYTLETAEENKNLLENKVASTTSIGQIKVGYGLEISSNGLLSVSKRVAEDANIISYDLPVGSYMFWAGKGNPEYFITPSGQTLSKAEYKELWQYANDNGLVPKLYQDVSDTHFKVVDLRDRFIKTPLDDTGYNDLTAIFQNAGLPNITGSFRGISYGDGGGAFSYSSKGFGYANFNASNGDVARWNFNANNGATTKGIYGNSTTVTPKNVTLKLILKALPTPPTKVVPVGTILDYTGNSAPNGYVIANGTELSREEFKDLYNWAVANSLMKNQSEIPSTPHAYYGTGNGSTTFTIPDLRGVFKRNADLSSNRGGTSLGGYQSDELPNIQGSIPVACTGNGGQNILTAYGGSWGALWGSENKDLTYRLGSGTFQRKPILNFNAWNYNHIYIDNGTVKPRSVSIVPIIKY